MKNFIIVGTQRTGSGALAESIGLNPMVTCGWEWTLHVPYRQKLKVAERSLAGDFSSLIQLHQDHMAKIFDSRKAWLGFRRLFSSSNKWIIHPRYSLALYWDRFEDHISWIMQRPDIHIIHIVRRVSLDWLKSLYLARKTKLYVGKFYPEGTKVRIPIKKAVARLRSKDWVDYRLATLTNTNPYICINYEDFLANQKAITELVLKFLQCDPTKMRISERRKQSKGEVADYVLNYNELLNTIERLDLQISRFDQL